MTTRINLQQPLLQKQSPTDTNAVHTLSITYMRQIIGILLVIAILILFTIFYSSNLIHKINDKQNPQAAFSEQQNECTLPDQTPSISEQELIVLSYYSGNKCSEYAEKRKQASKCNDLRKRFCNCIRVNLLNDININYLGDDDTVKYAAGHIRKVFDVYKYLTLLKSKYTETQQKESIVIMFADAFDTMYQTNSDEVLRRFNEFGIKDKVIWQAEKNCYPRKDIAGLYPEPPKNSIQSKYLNAGGYIGYLYYVHANFAQFIDFIDDPRGYGYENYDIDGGVYKGDQEIITLHITDYYNTSKEMSKYMTLDYYSKIMQSMWHMYDSVKFKPGFGYFNSTTIHFNGDKSQINNLVNQYANNVFKDKPGKGKVNGDREINLTNYNITRAVKYRDFCSKFHDFYY